MNTYYKLGKRAGRIAMYNVIDYLESSAVRYSDKTAIIEEDKSITYSDFLDKCKRVGSFLGAKLYFNEPILSLWTRE